jgi:hypothetical protein
LNKAQEREARAKMAPEQQTLKSSFAAVAS